MMDVERPLHWRQGLFLQPHHFQLFERSLRSLFAPSQNLATPYFWGVEDVEIEKTALGTRSFVVGKGSFLFSDGAYVSFPGNAFLEPRPFNDAWIEGGLPLTVYVGIRKWNSSGENVSIVEKTEGLSSINTRFVSPAQAEEVKDLHSGGPSAEVERLTYHLKIFYETEREHLGDYLLIPIAQLEKMGDEVMLSEHFIPPCLSITGSDTLFKIVKEIRDQLAARSRQLEEQKRQRGIQSAEFGSRDMVYLLALRSINRYVPALFHITDTKQVHPWAVYGLLRQLIGELSSFSEKVDVLGQMESEGSILPVYEHLEIWPCFSAAQTLVSMLLDEITAGPDYIIRLVYDNTYFAADLKPAIFEGRSRFFLVLKTDTDPKLVVGSAINDAKLSSREHLPILIARALPGLGLEHLPVPPQELPRRAGSVYFAIDHHGNQWAKVKKGNNVALYWDNAPKDLVAELMVVGR